MRDEDLAHLYGSGSPLPRDRPRDCPHPGATAPDRLRACRAGVAMTARTDPDRLRRLRDALDNGMSVLEAARHVGVAKDVLYRARDRGELDLSQAPKSRRHSADAQMGTIPVPAWAIKLGLAEDYRDFTRVLGEDYAARICRQLSAEARA